MQMTVLTGLNYETPQGRYQVRKHCRGADYIILSNTQDYNTAQQQAQTQYTTVQLSCFFI